MKIDSHLPIARIAAELPGAIQVFESLGLDYACAGDRSLDDAAHAEGLDTELVVSSLRRLHAAEHAQTWHERPLAELVRYLVSQHHRFVRDELGVLSLRLADVTSTYCEVIPEILSVRAAFTRLTEIMLPHLHHEEQSIFVTVEAMEATWQSNEPRGWFPHDLTADVRRLTVEHGMITAQLRTLRNLRTTLADHNDIPPRIRAVLDDLGLLEAHLHEYMFLENCVLFPRALALAADMTVAAG